jgi:ubiquinone/menaquinone biosynthesis C-methylase UbiE
MAWYDIFSSFYDNSLEKLFIDARAAAADALKVEANATILDLPTGTGQSLGPLQDRLDGTGRIIAVDLSKGMLGKARSRAERAGWTNVDFIQRDVHELCAADLEEAAGAEVQVDRLHIFLGMSVFPDMDRAFENLFSLLKPGGRVVVLDTYAEKPSFQGKMVNLMARADIRRKFWEPVEKRCEDFNRREIPSLPQHGGALILCSGQKPERS